jgi:hypothetical protein
MTNLVTVETPQFTATVPDLFAYPMGHVNEVLSIPDGMEKFAYAVSLFTEGLAPDKLEEFLDLSTFHAIDVIQKWLQVTADNHRQN